MLIEKTIEKECIENFDSLTPDIFYIDWHETGKKLLRGQTTSGVEIGIRIAEGIKDGDILFADSDKYIRVEVKACKLTRVKIHSIIEMGRLCFELGNRHLSLSINTDYVDTPFDEPTFEYLKHIGFSPETVNEKFTNFTICHGHSH